MNVHLERAMILLLAGQSVFLNLRAMAATRVEHFDKEPVNWEGVNNRSTNFPVRIVAKDFGYDARSRHIGEAPGEVGGKITPVGEIAFYGYRLPKALSLDEPLSAS